jgi:hypothetical protein
VTVLALALFALAGCTQDRPLFAPSYIGEGIAVRVAGARIQDDHCSIKAILENRSDQTIVLARDGLALRLPDGRALRPEPSWRSSDIVVEPGDEGHLRLEFDADRSLDDVTLAWLIVGGVRVGAGQPPRVVAQLPLSRFWPAAPPGNAYAWTTALPEPTATIAVDMRSLDDASFRRLDGGALEKQILVRLVQEGFAVVATTRRSAVALTIVAKGDRIEIAAQGPSGTMRRQLSTRDVPLRELHLELAQKASDLARSVAYPAPSPRMARNSER